MNVRRRGSVALVLAGMAVAVGATTAHAADSRVLTVAGAAPQELGICGGARSVALRPAGQQPAVKVRRPRAHDVLIVDRCESGRWQRQVRRKAKSGTVKIKAPQTGDYRIRIRRRGKSRAVAVAYLRLLTDVVPAPGAPPAPPAVPGDDVVDIPLTFHVKNQNRSRVACSSDGKDYDVKGHLVAPRSVLTANAPTVTLYLHGIGFGEFYWHFKAVPGYDYAGLLASEGHASVTYDMLDYGGSGKPPPDQTCYGSEADVASQIAGALRKGDYTAEGGGKPKFGRVALASHSVSGLTSQPEAYSFKDVDALIVTSWADQGFSNNLSMASAQTEANCAAGGDNNTGYASFSDESFRALFFANTDKAVEDAATGLRAPVPCGEAQSAFTSISMNVASDSEITVPVLLAYGSRDGTHNQPDAGNQQKSFYTGSDDVTLSFIEGSGSALALEKTAPAYRRLMADWLSARGF